MLLMTLFIGLGALVSSRVDAIPQDPFQMISASSTTSGSGDEWQEEYITVPGRPTLRTAPAEAPAPLAPPSLAVLVRQLVLTTLALSRR